MIVGRPHVHSSIRHRALMMVTKNTNAYAALVLLISLPQHGASVDHGGTTMTAEIFQQTVFSSQLNYTVLTPSTSLSTCARHCLRSPACHTLCYNVSTSVCYINEGSSSSTSQPVAGGSSDLSCFTSQDCPTTQGYSMHGGLCVKLYTDAMTYMDATHLCKPDGAHLVHFKSEAYRTALMSLFDSEGGVGEVLWVGADDLDTEGTFVWRSDGTQLPTFDPLWGTGEPNNLYGIEHCAHIYTTLFELNDCPCTSTREVVCQVDV